MVLVDSRNRHVDLCTNEDYSFNNAGPAAVIGTPQKKENEFGNSSVEDASEDTIEGLRRLLERTRESLKQSEASRQALTSELERQTLYIQTQLQKYTEHMVSLRHETVRLREENKKLKGNDNLSSRSDGPDCSRYKDCDLKAKEVEVCAMRDALEAVNASFRREKKILTNENLRLKAKVKELQRSRNAANHSESPDHRLYAAPSGSKPRRESQSSQGSGLCNILRESFDKLNVSKLNKIHYLNNSSDKPFHYIDDQDLPSSARVVSKENIAISNLNKPSIPSLEFKSLDKSGYVVTKQGTDKLAIKQYFICK